MKASGIMPYLAFLLAVTIILSGCGGEAVSPTPTVTDALTPSPTLTPSPEPTDVATPTPTATPTADIPAELLASNFGFLGATHDAEALEEIGVRWDRPHPGPFIWGRIEQGYGEGEYDWEEVDEYVVEAQSHGFATLATIWPFSELDQAAYSTIAMMPDEIVFEEELGRARRRPFNMDNYKAFVTALVERYDGDGVEDMPGLRYPIKHWEASNEPSMQSGFNWFFDGKSQEYLEILQATYEAVKEADSEALVLHAGMAGMDPDMVTFWEPIFEQGCQYFDIANIHSIGASDELNVPAFRALLDKYGIDKPIWVTEAQHRSGETFQGTTVTEEEHGRIMLTSYVLAFGLGTDKIFYTTFRAPPFGEEEFSQSALVEWNGEQRPAFHALNTMIQKLDGFTSVEVLGEGRYRFEVGDDTIYVLWGEGPVPEEITGFVVVTDMYGEEMTMTTEALTIDYEPLFVETVSAG